MSDPSRPAIRQAISTPHAPAAIGPYSQAIRSGALLFVSGQIPLDPATGTIVSGGITEQTRQVLRNLAAILAEAGISFHAVVKTTVYLADMADFGKMNEVYASCFEEPEPARATIQAAGLPRNVLVEIELIAAL